MESISKKSLILELTFLTAGLLILTRILFLFRSIAIVDKMIPLAVAVLFLYAPIIAMWKRGRRIDFLDRGFSEYVRSISVFLLAALIIFPLFLLGAHFWISWVYGLKVFHCVGVRGFWNVLAFHLILVALPEEFYFRGYFQSAMDRIWPRRWSILGVRLGWGWIITAAVFAVAHTIVSYKWWHFSIFFPALVFGYLRERTGTITAPILFHAASNIIMNWFLGCYS